MSHHENKRLDQSLQNNIQRKLLLTLLVVAIIPIISLAAAFTVGAFQTVAIVIAVVSQIVGLVIAHHFASGILQQAATINETLVEINTGNFEARAEILTKDELGEAAVALNAMCDNTLNLIQSNDERDQIQASIENLISEMKDIASGDLTITADVKDDMTGSIAASVNHMTEQLRLVVRQAQYAAGQVTDSAAQIRESSTSMSQDRDVQASRIGQACEHLLDMTDSFQQGAELAKESVQVAVEARRTASDGLKAVSDTVDGMQRIRDQVQSTSKRIKRLGESSQEIGEIVQLISDIADRTSILALNASIQAATAGDAGQGFAVVAEEIERLAERSTDATKQISKLIRAIQNETSEVISDMEESTREVVAGSQLATEAGETLAEIDSVSNQLVELIQTSSSSALQKADKATKIARAMSMISQSTKESAEESREATRSVGKLAEMVGELRDSVSQFKVADGGNQFHVQNKWSDTRQPAAQTRSTAAPTQAAQSRSTPAPTQAADAIDEQLLRQAREASEMLKKTNVATCDLDSLEGQRNPASSDRERSGGTIVKTMLMDES